MEACALNAIILERFVVFRVFNIQLVDSHFLHWRTNVRGAACVFFHTGALFHSAVNSQLSARTAPSEVRLRARARPPTQRAQPQSRERRAGTRRGGPAEVWSVGLSLGAYMCVHDARVGLALSRWLGQKERTKNAELGGAEPRTARTYPKMGRGRSRSPEPHTGLVV